MATPITQSKTDEERDRLVEQTIVDPELMQMASGSLDESIVEQQQRISMATTVDGRSSVSGPSTIFNAPPPPQTMTMMMDTGGGGGGGTPQSPIVYIRGRMDWNVILILVFRMATMD